MGSDDVILALAAVFFVCLSYMLFDVGMLQLLKMRVTLPRVLRKEILSAVCMRDGLGGPPRHIAFIMDGNRRWAKRQGLRATDGHPRGGDRLLEVLQWCMDAGIDVVTIYAFSIENFKRSETEVESIMKLAKEHFDRMCEDGDLVQECEFRLRILGDRKRIPQDVRESMDRAIEATCHHRRRTLNVCFSYTSRDEMLTALDMAIRNRSGTQILDEIEVSRHLFTAENPELDILIRTSGDHRLSDFLLWQSSFSHLAFPKATWPEFTFYDFVNVLLEYYGLRSERHRMDVKMNLP
uniref:Alkyl transferase n=1 Tax=Compsopogon caeruleus TaxID=31354 RepID=A0A7S1TCL0_9RHOD